MLTIPYTLTYILKTTGWKTKSRVFITILWIQIISFTKKMRYPHFVALQAYISICVTERCGTTWWRLQTLRSKWRPLRPEMEKLR